MATSVENWDDDVDFDNFDDVQLRSASTTTSIVSQPANPHHRDSSSRMSMRSDSNQGDEHWDVIVDDQSPVKDALSIAKSKGFTLPANLPRSALEGGTIRKLGGRAVKKAISADDWSEDLEFSNTPGQLKLAKLEDRDLSENLRQISAAFHVSPKSPDLPRNPLDSLKSPKSRLAPAPVSFESFQEIGDDDFDDVPTIRVAKHRSPQKSIVVSSSKPELLPELDDFDDLELPDHGKLRLATKRLTPTTPNTFDDFDVEWEGSLGTRTAGLVKSGRSNRSSSVSAFSPSVSSAFTAESDDGLEGLVLPSGPLSFREVLKKREEHEKENQTPETNKKFTTTPQANHEEDWDNDLVIPSDRVFDSDRVSLHQNLKIKSTTRTTSPSKIKATTLNFTTTRSSAGTAREPRFSHGRQERQRQQLEPVSETGAAISRYQRPSSRLGHQAQSSTSSIPAPTASTPSTPSRKDLRHVTNFREQKLSQNTSAQLLRTKRSSAALSNIYSPVRSAFPRPPSRQDGAGSRLRPRSPERSDSRIGSDKRSAAPFLPAGVSTAQSQHVSLKSTRSSRRNDSEGSGDSMTAAQRSLSRLAGLRPQTPVKDRSAYTIADLAAQAKKTINRPLRRRNWGDGSELESFDDLPTSLMAEAKFTKLPIGKGAPRSLRSKLGQSQPTVSSASLVSVRSGFETPLPTTPHSPSKTQEQHLNVHTNIPRFARDTTASRNAREQRQISTTLHNIRGEPINNIAPPRTSIVSSRPPVSLRRKKSVQQKPHLIKALGDHHKAKEVKGMYYNPHAQRWEGNDNILASFDVPDFEPISTSMIHANVRATNHNSPTSSKTNIPLIMNVGGKQGVELVNGMVFDPQQMKWLKVAEGASGRDQLPPGSIQLEEEEDVFAGLEDLKEESESAISGRRSVNASVSVVDPFQDGVDDGDAGNGSASGDEWPTVGEEYDVGPEFIRRQRAEEERWNRKVAKWIRTEEDEVDPFEIRNLVNGLGDGGGAFGMVSELEF